MTPAPAVRGERQDRDLGRTWIAVIWIVTAVIAAPFLLPGWLPLTDLPEHAAAMSSIAHWGEPVFRIDEHYRIGWRTSQYLLVHLVGGGLTKIVGDAEVACRIILIGLAVGWVQSARVLLRAFGLDQRLAIMSAVLFWNRALCVGFLPYVASLPMLFATIALFVRQIASGEGPWSRRSRWLVFAALAVFYAHASAFTLLATISLALALKNSRAPSDGLLTVRLFAVLRDAAPRVLWLLPAGILACLWVVRGRLGLHGSPLHDSADIATMNPLRAVKLIAFYAHDVWTSHLDDWVGVGFWILFIGLLLTGERSPRVSTRSARAQSVVGGTLAPFVVAFLVYLVMPFRVGTGVLLNVRMAPVLGFLALLGLRPKRGAWGSVPIACSIALVCVQCAENVAQMSRLQRDVDGLPQLLGSLRKGSRLITLNFSGFDPSEAHFTPWLHVGSYHRAMNGGVASFSFSELSHWSVQYRPESAPPAQAELSWGMRPCLFRNASDGVYFDYVLVRGALDPFANGPPGPRWRVLGKTIKYTVYEKDSLRPPVPPSGVVDDGPCPPTSDRDAH